jgi:hypothetical protein
VNNNDGKIIFETRGGETKVIEKRPVGRPKQEIQYGSSNPTAFNLTKPEALQTELTTLNQIRKDEGTLIWGSYDDLPVRILNAIAKSPTTSSCIGKLEQFTRGSGFSDKKLMDLVINKDGQTLWQLHCELVKFYCSLDAYSVNFKYNSEGQITNTYCIDTAGVRFSAEANTNTITGIKYNPYFGTTEYRKAFTTEYSIYNSEALQSQIKEKGTKFNGQVYFYGEKSPLYKHYPVPKFWSGEKWIYSDAKLAIYIDTLLDNGFFQSVILRMIGDPNKMSNHPDAMREITGDDGVKRKESYKTEGQMFNELMSSNFSGVHKAAKAIVLWSLNKDQSATIEGFPSNTNFDFVAGTLRETIRMITISTELPGILANLPDEVSPLAGQDALKRAIEFVQSNTAPRRFNLQSFYNTILLPNLVKPYKGEVEILQYNPASIQVTVDKQFWEFMNEAEKIAFIKKNEPNIEIIREPVASTNTAPATVDENGNTVQAPTVPKVDEVLKGLKVQEINRILSVVKKVAAGSLTPDQAKLLLSGYGLNEEQINAFLNPQTVEE